MAMEAMSIYQKDPFIHTSKEYNYSMGVGEYGLFGQNAENLDINGYWDNSTPNSSVAHTTTTTTSSSPETCGGGAVVPVAAQRRKRRRTKRMKNKEEMENQRMTHIAVERNRRRQMNDYLAVLRSLMPPSYGQRGDQASIVGGAINFVKELEQLLQFLEAHKLTSQQQQEEQRQEITNTDIFSDFFTFPQYSTRPRLNSLAAVDMAAERRSSVADIEVTMVESHANIKILLKRSPKQLLKMVAGFQSVCLTILHLNITTVDQSVLYSFSVKVEDECKLTTVNEIATTVHDMVGMIQEESGSS